MFSPESSLGAVRVAALYAAMAPLPPTEAPPVDLRAIEAMGYAHGFADGAAEAEARLAPVRNLHQAAAAAYAAATAVDPEALRGVFAELVTALAEAVVAAELQTDPALVARLVNTALAAVTLADSVSVRLHPDDAGTVADAVADPALPRGTVVVDAPAFVVRDGLATRLAALIEELV